jgi:hypothetical protein
MQAFDPRRRHTLAALSALAAAGCGGPDVFGGGVAGPPLPAPVYRVGDRWTYDCSDGYRQPVTWVETHTVTRAGPSGIDVGVVIDGPTMKYQRVEHLLAPGIVTSGEVYDNVETRNFVEPLVRYPFPLTPGTSSQQSLQNFDPATQLRSNIQRRVRVDGYASVSVPAGTFNALTLRILMVVDDNNPFRYPTNCNYQVWWAAEAGAMVRMTKYATYIERGDGPAAVAVRAQNTTMELAAFSYGARG